MYSEDTAQPHLFGKRAVYQSVNHALYLLFTRSPTVITQLKIRNINRTSIECASDEPKYGIHGLRKDIFE